MNAVIYARYSSDNQREESIEGQLRECGAFAERKGYTIVKTYADRAISGKKADNRPQFMQMIADSKQSLFDTVIVWKIDRFSRDKYDSVFYKNTLKKNGVSVISATEPIDDTPEGQLMESIFEGFSVYYIKDLSMKVSRGMTENVLNGKFNGGSLTFGYRIDENKHFQPDPIQAPIVQDIFIRYAGGEGAKSILNSLIAQGVTNQRGKNLTYSFITHILKNRRYLGEYRFKDTVVENAFTPLITKDIFDKCQKRLAVNKKKPAHFKDVQDKYILTGKIFCGYCGSSMSGVSGTSKTGVTHRYYHYRAAKARKSCNKKRIQKDLIENFVIDYTINLLNDEDIINHIVDTCYKLQMNKDGKLPAMNKRLKQIENELDNVMNAIKQGLFSPTIKSTLDTLEEEKAKLELAISKEQIERPALSKEQIRCWIDRFRPIDKEDLSQRQLLIDAFINSIYVYDDKFPITYNYKDGEKCISHEEIQEYMQKKENSENSYAREYAEEWDIPFVCDDDDVIFIETKPLLNDKNIEVSYIKAVKSDNGSYDFAVDCEQAEDIQFFLAIYSGNILTKVYTADSNVEITGVAETDLPSAKILIWDKNMQPCIEVISDISNYFNGACEKKSVKIEPSVVE